MNKTIVTHNSSYHADDVFAVAVLTLIDPTAKVVRTRDKELIEKADYVVDVGYEEDASKRRFDHHQPGGAGERPNGIPYASFGLVWRKYGEILAGGKREAEIIDRILVQPLDAQDNGVTIADYRYDNVRKYTIVDFVYSFLPHPYETEENLYNIFMRVVCVARELFQREIGKAKETIVSEDAVKKVYEESKDKRIVVLDKEYEWQNFLINTPDTIYVVYPRNDGKWSVKGVQVSSKQYGVLRKPFPEAWAGKQDAELADITGVRDAIFAHRGRFMAVAESQEGAVELAKLALNA